MYEEHPRWRNLLSRLGKGTRHHFPQAPEPLLVKGVGGRDSALRNVLRVRSFVRTDLCEFRDSSIDTPDFTSLSVQWWWLRKDCVIYFKYARCAQHLHKADQYQRAVYYSQITFIQVIAWWCVCTRRIVETVKWRFPRRRGVIMTKINKRICIRTTGWSWTLGWLIIILMSA